MKLTNLLLSVFLAPFIVLPEALGDEPEGQLNITQVFVDNLGDPTTIMIIGEDLLFGPNFEAQPIW